MSVAEPDAYTFDEPSPAGPRMGVLVAVAAGSAVLIGGGAFAVAQMMGGGGDRPASAMPAGTTAYLQLDIDPASGQKIAAVEFLKGIESEELQSLRDGDLKRQGFELLSQEESMFNALDYDEDVEPWLGDRLGLGMLTVDQGGEPSGVLAIQVTDQGAAEEAMTKVDQDKAEWFFHGDYLVLAEAGQADAVQQDVEAGNLAEQEYFEEDLESLGEQGVLTGWMDLAALSQLSSDLDGADLGALGMDPFSELYLGSDFGSLSEGRAAMTVRFASDSIEVAGATRGTPLAGLDPADTAHLITALPSDTVAAFSLENGDQVVDLLWDQVSALAPEEVASAQEEAAAAGLELPADLKVLVGDSMTLSAGRGLMEAIDASSEQVPVGYRAHTDTERVEALVELLLAESGMTSEELVTFRTDDGVFTLGATEPYVEELATGGDLGSSDLFSRAVPEADRAQSVIYLDVNAIEQYYLPEIEDEQDRAALEKLAAVGVSTSIDEDGNGSFLLRTVTD